MLCNDIAQVEDADQVGQLLDLDHTAGAIGYAVIVAPDGDEAVVADAALQLEHGIEAMLGQRLQLGLLGGKRLACSTWFIRLTRKTAIGPCTISSGGIDDERCWVAPGNCRR